MMTAEKLARIYEDVERVMKLPYDGVTTRKQRYREWHTVGPGWMWRVEEIRPDGSVLVQISRCMVVTPPGKTLCEVLAAEAEPKEE